HGRLHVHGYRRGVCEAAGDRRILERSDTFRPTRSGVMNISLLPAVLTRINNEPPESSGLPTKITRQPPVTIDTFLRKQQFLSLAEHMGNGNPLSHFLTVWRDGDGSAKFAKAKPHKRADMQASWTWDTITGKSKRKT